VLPESATLFAPAKLTWTLRVTGVRPDGMHVIDAEMVTLDFGDMLTLNPGDQVTYQGTWNGQADGTDLVSRALDLVGQKRSVNVIKQIPVGAGLGGGSSDAAAVLSASGWTDLDQAAALGADIAFCLDGGRAHVSGIGEVVAPLPFVHRTVTLLSPPLHCSTPDVYRAWDELGGPVGQHGNDLEPAALHVEPELATWRDRLERHSGQRPRLAGSGATWFVEGAFPGPDLVVAHTTRSRSEQTFGSTE